MLFVAAADLADEHHLRGRWILFEHLDHVAERQAQHRVAADPDDRRLAHPGGGERRCDLIREGAAARNQADRPRLGDALGDDPDLRLAGRDEAGAVGAKQARLRITAEKIFDPDHLLDRDAFRDADDEGDACRGGLHDRVGRERRRDEDARSVGACRLDRVRHRVEHRDAEMGRPSLARADAADDLRAQGLHLFGMKRAFAAGDPLDDHRRRRVDEDAHSPPRSPGRLPRAAAVVGPSAFVSSTIFCAAAHALTPGSMPFRFRMSRPSSSLVPLRRTTSGSFIFRLSRAVMMPLATSSPRVIPPNTLITTPLTFGFMRITASAFSTTSALAPPPMSQKFAGLPPARWTRSSVLMHRPAPLPMIPMSPSSET